MLLCTKLYQNKMIFVDIWQCNDLQYGASLPRLISKFRIYVT